MSKQLKFKDMLDIIILVICIIPAAIVLLMILNLFESFFHKIKTIILPNEILYTKQEHMHRIDYMKEIVRSDGWLLERELINVEEYIMAMRNKKLEKINFFN